MVPFLKVANDTAVAVNQCFAPETTVFTAEGPKPIAEVKVGDLVLGQRGRYREVTEHFVYDQKDAPMVQVAVKHSVNDLKVTEGHPFWAIQGVPMEQSHRAHPEPDRTAGASSRDWVEAGQLARGDYVAQVIPVRGRAGGRAHRGRCPALRHPAGRRAPDARLRNSASPATPALDGGHLQFVRDYLTERGIHFWENGRGETYLQIKWSVGRGLARCATTGQYVGLDQAQPALRLRRPLRRRRATSASPAASATCRTTRPWP